jgi:GTP cyclohydrolase II
MNDNGLHFISESNITLKRKQYTLIGKFKVYGKKNVEFTEHVVFVKGDVINKENILLRVHSECITGDLFGSTRCDCGLQLDLVYELMSKEEDGIIIYLRDHEGRGIGLSNKIRSYKIQEEEKLDTIDANLRLNFKEDHRSYKDAIEILKDLKVKSVNLLTNNPQKVKELKEYVSTITGLNTIPTDENRNYLTTKKERCNHSIVF